MKREIKSCKAWIENCMANAKKYLAREWEIKYLDYCQSYVYTRDGKDLGYYQFPQIYLMGSGLKKLYKNE